MSEFYLNTNYAYLSFPLGKKEGLCSYNFKICSKKKYKGKEKYYYFFVIFFLKT